VHKFLRPTKKTHVTTVQINFMSSPGRNSLCFCTPVR
jgi:hypothetical protein